MHAPQILRPLDPGEAFFYLLDHVSCMNFVVFAERLGHLRPERIHRALSTLQRDNLLLQASIGWTQQNGLCFEHAPDSAVELRCRQVTDDDWQHSIEHQLSEPFAIGASPLMRCLYLEITGPTDAQALPHTAPGARSVLALCFHHSVGDGRSGTELLRRLLGLIASDTAQSATTGPTALPTMAGVHPARFRWDEQTDAARQLRNTLIGDYRRHGALTAIPWLASEAAQRTPRFIRISLPAETTQGLISRARTLGTSLHGVLCAAQLLAQFRLHPGSEPITIFLSCPVDMRAHLEPVQPVSPTGLFVSLISGSYLIDADTPLWTLARDVIVQTRLQITRGEGHLLFNMYGLDGSPVPPAFMEPFRKKALASLPNTMVSNVGAIASVPDDPAVQAISFALCPMPYQTLFTAASTYKGQLILNIGFDAARLTEENARTLADAIREILLTAVAA